MDLTGHVAAESPRTDAGPRGFSVLFVKYPCVLSATGIVTLKSHTASSYLERYDVLKSENRKSKTDFL